MGTRLVPLRQVRTGITEGGIKVKSVKEIQKRIKEIFQLKLESCYCENRKDKTEDCDHCQPCMEFNYTIEELEWVITDENR